MGTVSSTSGYSVRPLLSDDTGEALQLLRAAMPESGVPRTREFWEWKHLQNPFAHSTGFVATHEGKMIGVRVFLPWNWWDGTQIVVAGRAVDTATHPDWHGKGIFSDLTNRLIERVRSEGMKFIFNTPNKKSLPGYLKMGWRIVSRIPVWLRPLRPFSSIFRMAGFPHNSSSGLNDGSLESFFQETDIVEHLNRRLEDQRFQTVRTKDYLIWRYLKIPGFCYLAKWRQTNDSFAAVIYREKKRKQLCEIGICELFLSQNKRGTQLAVEILKEIFHESRADYAIATFALHTPELAVLKQSGFFSLGRRGPIFTVRMLENEIKPMRWADWRCSLGDLELF